MEALLVCAVSSMFLTASVGHDKTSSRLQNTASLQHAELQRQQSEKATVNLAVQQHSQQQAPTSAHTKLT